MRRRRQTDKVLSPKAQKFYHTALGQLLSAGVPFLVGGAYAFGHYTGISRHTKDFDIFTRQRDSAAILHVLAEHGYHTEVTSPYWLAKAFCNKHFIDIIYGSANGVAPVDELWFERAHTAEILGYTLKVVPPEEMIWQKAFIMERERFDGADVAHLLLKQGIRLDWYHLLDRFASNWRVLLSHLILFQFIYPASREAVPSWVLRELLQRAQRNNPGPIDDALLCNGTLLSGEQYAVDVGQWGFENVRQLIGGETPEQQVQRQASDELHHDMAS
ncbi:MAG TPA: nucleotidyltransferase [Ktedonobacterales bacterium]|jgi:hypothetical protein|nr:nucleotidyltransferase [Ktedonobacterales bacterium]